MDMKVRVLIMCCRVA